MLTYADLMVCSTWSPAITAKPVSDAPIAPAKKWTVPVGYVPPAVDALSSAPAKKWQPYGGYEPKRERETGDRPRSALASAAAAVAPASILNTIQRSTVTSAAAAGTIYIHVYIHIYVCVYTYTFICVCIYIHTHTHTRTRVYIHTYIHTHIHIHTYIYTYTYIYILLYETLMPWSSAVAENLFSKYENIKLSAGGVEAEVVGLKSAMVDTVKAVVQLDHIASSQQRSISELKAEVHSLKERAFLNPFAGQPHAETDEELRVKKAELEDVYTAVYSPEIEAQRLEREKFYKYVVLCFSMWNTYLRVSSPVCLCVRVRVRVRVCACALHVPATDICTYTYVCIKVCTHAAACEICMYLCIRMQRLGEGTCRHSHFFFQEPWAA
jgi:hypothetical protein